VHPDVDSIVKRDHITRLHPNAASRLANPAFLWRAVNVYATIVRRAILSFRAATS